MLRISLDETWYRIPDAREIGVRRSSLGRLSTFESLWEAWRDPIRVLIRVLQLQGRGASHPLPLPGSDSDGLGIGAGLSRTVRQSNRGSPPRSGRHPRRRGRRRSVSSGSPGARSHVRRLRSTNSTVARNPQRLLPSGSGWFLTRCQHRTVDPDFARRRVTEAPAGHPRTTFRRSPAIPELSRRYRWIPAAAAGTASGTATP